MGQRRADPVHERLRPILARRQQGHVHRQPRRLRLLARHGAAAEHLHAAGSLSERDIGRELYISRNTIHSHTKSIYRKLGVSSRALALEKGRELGLIPHGVTSTRS